MATNVVGFFDDREDAQDAVQDLMKQGFPRESISVVAADQSGGGIQSHGVDEEGNQSGKGIATGATSGAVVGGIIGILAGLGMGFVPFLGFLVAGPLAGLITGAVAGAVAGGLLGGLIGLGIPEEHAHAYAEGVRRGGTLVTVHTEETQADKASKILDDHDAVDIEERAAQYRQEGFTKFDQNAKPYTAAEAEKERERYRNSRVATNAAAMDTAATGTVAPGQERKLDVVEEKLSVGKREVQQGGVRVRSYVTEKPVTEQVQLRQEHVNVERNPVDRPASAKDFDTFKEGTIEVTETSEVPVVAKEARVVEEVVVGKTADTRTETVNDTVRRTDVKVEPINGQSGQNFDDSYYRTDFDRNFANSGGRYEEYQPAYQYGSQLSADPRYQNSSWSASEANIRQDWEARHPGTWDRFRGAIQNAFTRSHSRTEGNRAELI